jgi:hypothetical protein
MQAGFYPETALFAISASILGIACAAYLCTPPRNPLISLILQKINRFQIRNWRCLHLSFWMDTSWEKVFSKFLFFSAVARTGSPHPTSYEAIKTYF